MGADGPGLFSDDTAMDVRDAYLDALEDGLSDAEAEQRVLEGFAEELADADERVVVVLALAFVESKAGRLSSTMRDQSLAFLDAGGDIERWRRDAGPSQARRREAVLSKIRMQLTGPQPERRHGRRRHRPSCRSRSVRYSDTGASMAVFTLSEWSASTETATRSLQ